MYSLHQTRALVSCRSSRQPGEEGMVKLQACCIKQSLAHYLSPKEDRTTCIYTCTCTCIPAELFPLPTATSPSQQGQLRECRGERDSERERYRMEHSYCGFTRMHNPLTLLQLRVVYCFNTYIHSIQLHTHTHKVIIYTTGILLLLAAVSRDSHSMSVSSLSAEKNISETPLQQIRKAYRFLLSFSTWMSALITTTSWPAMSSVDLDGGGGGGGMILKQAFGTVHSISVAT